MLIRGSSVSNSLARKLINLDPLLSLSSLSFSLSLCHLTALELKGKKSQASSRVKWNLPLEFSQKPFSPLYNCSFSSFNLPLRACSKCSKEADARTSLSRSSLSLSLSLSPLYINDNRQPSLTWTASLIDSRRLVLDAHTERRKKKSEKEEKEKERAFQVSVKCT